VNSAKYGTASASTIRPTMPAEAEHVGPLLFFRNKRTPESLIAFHFNNLGEGYRN
jgi:hypothetical protein